MDTLGQKLARTGRAYFWSIAIWSGFAPIMAGQEKVRMWEGGVPMAYWKVLLVTGAWCMTAAVLTPPLFYIVRISPITRGSIFKRVVAYALGSIPYLVVSVFVRALLLPSYNSVTHEFRSRSMHDVMLNTHLFATQIWDYVVIIVAAHAYEYFARSRNQELEQAQLQHALVEVELQALKSQLQPHFLFNTLQGISALIEVDKTRAKNMVLKLSNLLRAALHEHGSNLVTLEKELQFAEAYLDIEKMRLEGRLEFSRKIEPGTGHLLVPSLILQPLIENAVEHGIACAREGGWLQIEALRSHERLELVVRNSVGGKSCPGSGLGLQNTRARLKALYSGEASLSFEISEGRVACALLSLPILETSNVEVQTQSSDPQSKTT